MTDNSDGGDSEEGHSDDIEKAMIIAENSSVLKRHFLYGDEVR